MIMKTFTCWVDEDQRAAFDRGQIQWRSLKGVPGFLGQTGGWAEEGQALIVSFWQDTHSYNRFEKNHHDPIFERSKQQGLYAAPEKSIWQNELAIPGSLADLPDALRQGGFIRIALCQVPETRRPHFIEVQRAIWNPGMAKNNNMLGGIFGRSGKEDFIILTFWTGQDGHQDYMNKTFPSLRQRANPEADCSCITGKRVVVEENWRVGA